MNTKQIKQAVLAAAVFAGGGMAYGDPASALQVVYCKATIVGSPGGEVVSVTLPPTEGYYDMEGNPLTFWNVGNVPAGGVADSWHQEGGPGRFTARNAGNVGAYFYVTTGDYYQIFEMQWEQYTYERFLASGGTREPDEYVLRDLIGGGNPFYLTMPSISQSELRRWNSPLTYHLAFTTDTMAKVPTWHSLDHRLWHLGARTVEYGGEREAYSWSNDEVESPIEDEVAGYMGYVDAGDYLPFDMKFWAPPRDSNPPKGACVFTFCVEASSFPLWDHGRAVE